MSSKRSIATNTLYQLLAKIISTTSTLVTSILVTRILGVAFWGDYSVVVVYITFYYLFTEFGLNGIAARDFAEKTKINISDFFNFLIVRAINTLLVVFISLFVLRFLNYDDSIKHAIVYAHLGLVFFSLGSAFNALFQSKLKYKYLFYSTLVFSITSLSVFLFFLFGGYQVNIFTLLTATIIGDFLRLLVSAFFGFSMLHSDLLVISYAKMKYFFATALPLGIALIFNTLMTQVDKLMLSQMVNSIEVGYYALSYKLFDVLLVLPTFFMNAAFTIWVKKYRTYKNYDNSFSLSIITLFFISVFITVIGLSCSWFLIPLIWGMPMSPSVISFNILISGSFLFYISSPLSWAFVVENKQHILAYLYFVGFIFNFFSNLYAIRKFGYLGAAITTNLTELLVVLGLILLVKKHLGVKFIKTPINISSLTRDLIKK